jgi:predicted RNA-binding Zn-ribbon protein involved in translation (DUF1610 family)
MAAPAALHLIHGWWIASCPECGHELARRRDQAKAEQVGERRRCPICRPTQQASRPSYRGLRLNGPLAEFQRAVDRLRWDTAPTPLDQPSAPPAPPRRGRRQVDGQADLLDPPPGIEE